MVPVDVDGQICHFCPQVFVREQILVNKSDKSDHPHQREPWCFAEVVNKVGAEAMAKKSKVPGCQTVLEQQSDLVKARKRPRNKLLRVLPD